MSNKEDFIASIATGKIPSGLSSVLQALWHDKRGDWAYAHNLIDQLTDPASAHVHAYLHRKEGDLWNADYWYRHAKRNRPAHTLDEEWESLVEEYIDFS